MTSELPNTLDNYFTPKCTMSKNSSNVSAVSDRTRKKSITTKPVGMDALKSDDSEDSLTLIRNYLKAIKDGLAKTVKLEDLKTIVSDIVLKLLGENNKERDELISKKVQEKCDEIEKERKSEITKIKNDLELAEKNIATLSEKLAECQKSLREMKNTAEVNQDKLDAAYTKSNYNEQYSRKTNFKVHGVTEKKGENTEDVVMKVIEEKAGVKIDKSDIMAVHRIPGPSDRERPILVKMRNSECKARVMKKRSKVKKEGSGVRLVDDVTRANANLISKLNSHEAIESAWYFNGSVYGQYKGKRIMFDITDDIDKKLKSKK